jgi:hypothetical protein
LARRLFDVGQMIELLLNPMYWDKKVRIAILTLATFASLC